MKPIIITGCKRSGTAYIASLLTVSGYWCSHERFFRGSARWRVDPKLIEQRHPHIIDSSYAAAPFLGKMDAHVIHQIRHPLLVIASIAARNGYDPEQRKDWTIKVCPNSSKPGDDRLSLILRFWLEWNRMISKHADFTWQFDRLDPSRVAEVLSNCGRPLLAGSVTYARSVLPDRINESIGGIQTLSWHDIPNSNLKDQVMEDAKAYGYDT